MLSLLVSSIVAVFTGLLSLPTQDTSPLGTWQRADSRLEAKFYPCGDKLCARITSTKSQGSLIRSGTSLVPGAAKTGHNMWEGSVIDSDSGNTVAGVITMQNRDSLTLKGCTAMVLCRVETWHRVN